MKTIIKNTVIALMLGSFPASAQQYYLLRTATGTGGGAGSGSSGYTMGSTVGQPGVGYSSSAGYNTGGGFWYQFESLQQYFSPRVIVNNGWNLLAVSPVVADFRAAQVYPSSVSAAFVFVPGGGYQARDTLRNGSGFWLKFAGIETLAVTGVVRIHDSIDVQAGWNMIGAVSLPVDTATITSNPPGIRSSQWYGYAGGFLASRYLLPGQGYWIKASMAGTFIFNAKVGSPARPGRPEETDPLASTDEFVVSERSGAKQSLYIEDVQTVVSEMSELPPTGPEGAFDVRFESQKSIEALNAQAAHTIVIHSSSYPVTLKWNLRNGKGRSFVVKDGITGYLMDPQRISGEGQLVITNPAITRLALTAGDGVPHEFALFQNYPNPFNPTTQIKFSVEKSGRATLEMFDILGQRVRTLFNEIAQAGRYYDLKVEGGNLASGVYFYRLQTEARSDVKKLMLVK